MRSKALKGLVLFSVLYLVSTSLGTILAIATPLPARFGGMLTGDNVLQVFLLINGTALSPDLAMLLGQLVLTICALRRGRVGMVGVIGLTLYGTCVILGQVGEPITVRAFSPSTLNGAQTSLVVANLVFPLLMVVCGVVEWSNRRQANRSASTQPEHSARGARQAQT
jgi:hypothetical protein